MPVFTPDPVRTYRFTVGTTAMQVTLPAKPNTIRIHNATATNILFVETGGTTVVIPTAATGTGAVALSTPGGMSITNADGPVLYEKGDATQISMISSATTCDVYITLGHGDWLA